MANITITPAKSQQILEAGRKQLSPEEFERLESLLLDLEIYGFSQWINTQLGTLMSKIEWELEIEPSLEWGEALKACDFAFLGEELKDMCRNAGLSPVGHKKLLCARLYRHRIPEVVTVMEPYLTEEERERIKWLPQTEHLWVSKLEGIKGRLEEIYRIDPDEFYQRKKLIEQAIKERERGIQKTMPELNLEELRDILEFTKRLYG